VFGVDVGGAEACARTLLGSVVRSRREACQLRRRRAPKRSMLNVLSGCGRKPRMNRVPAGGDRDAESICPVVVVHSPAGQNTGVSPLRQTMKPFGSGRDDGALYYTCERNALRHEASNAK
jgi:hypothetical protein